ncbi:hypothetical protein ACFSY7_10435 [Kurthia populi]|uniref:Uncharacterized protein n=1 Tax=Kurthia populi TaxID=1562132 RepID=A0ABW5Y0Z4_9BACL
MEILNQYINEEGKRVTQYSRDGVNVTHTVVDDVPQEVTEPIEEVPPTIEEKILYETQYQTMLIETSMSF